MENIHDLMSARTQQLIQKTCITLIEQTSFDKLSIRNLTTCAGIHRGTFYLHYEDKYDLIYTIQSQLLTGLEQVLLVDLSIQELVESYNHRIPYAPFIHIFSYMQDQGHLIQLLLSPKGEASFSSKLQELIQRLFYEKLQKNQSFDHHPDIPPDFLSAYASSTFIGITEQWLRTSESTYTVEDIAILYVRLLCTQLLPAYVTGPLHELKGM